MINENITFILFKYTSDTLSHSSHKKVLAICNECGKERLMEYRQYRDLCHGCSRKGDKNPMYGKHPSDETKLKMSKSQMGKHHTEETKLKMSKAQMGKKYSDETKLKMSKSQMGKHHTEETKLKMSISTSGENNPSFGKLGKNSLNWKGGKKLSIAKRNVKRRKLFGFIPHNKAQKDFHGHHIDFNHVIFIPKELHISIYHSVVNNINMDLINDIACDWYLKYQII